MCRKPSLCKSEVAALPVLRLCLQVERLCDQVLDEEDLIQECKVLYAHRIAFLMRPCCRLMGLYAHQVLDEEDLIQECKALNGRLIAFLKQPAVLAALLGYLVDAPPPSALTRFADIRVSVRVQAAEAGGRSRYAGRLGALLEC